MLLQYMSKSISASESTHKICKVQRLGSLASNPGALPCSDPLLRSNITTFSPLKQSKC